MKLANLRIDGRDRVAIVSPDGLAYRPAAAATMLDVIRGDPPVAPEAGAEWLPLGDARWLPALVPPRNILCVGKNYHAHAREFTRSGFDTSQSDPTLAVPDAPIVFTKAPQTAIGPYDEIPYPAGVSDCVDYEAELAVVIGRQGRGIRREDALGHVFGYMMVNDVTARDLQLKHKQWFIGKSLDGFCPMGPWIVTADEIDPAKLDICCRVNGELRQQASTADLIFDVATLIETISAGITLYPGDLIATGTPEGVGIGFTPPCYLQRGDEVAIEITGLGRMVNKVA